MSEILEVCEKCRGAGSMPTNPKDPMNNPPVQVCDECKGSGVPKKEATKP